MSDLTLVIGNKNYSSWSLRGWLALKQSGLPFEEVVVPLGSLSTSETILRYSPSGRVPVLRHGTLTIWDSLAIGEYVAELAPESQLLPAERSTRALARSVTAEMHSGFAELRAQLQMNLRATRRRPLTPEVQADINRITAIWRDLRRANAALGPFLFGQFTLADAAFAPVVSRFRTYGVPLDDVSQAYADAVWSLPAMKEWAAASANEPMVIERYEV